MKKRPLLILFALLLTFMLNRLQAQHFQFFDLPPNTELLPLTRFEVHENNLYFWLKEINFPSTKYYLARFDRSNIHTVALSTGLTPTIYNLKSYNGKLYAVLRNIRGNLGLYAHDGVSFTSIPLPTIIFFPSLRN